MKKNIISFFSLILFGTVLASTAIFAKDTCNGDLCVDQNGDINLQQPLYQQIAQNTLWSWSITTGSIVTWTVVNSWNKNDEIFFFTSTNTNEFTWSDELENAIRRGHKHGLTKYSTIEEYNANYALLREDASKLFYQASRVLGYTAQNFEQCTFSDITTVAWDLQQNINSVCKLGWLMQGDKGEFFPFRKLKNAEALTVLARITGIKDSTSSSARWTPYLEYVKKLHILDETQIDETTMETTITRGELIILLYRLGKIYDKYYGDFSLAINDPSNLPIGNSDSSVSIGAGIIDTPRFTNALLWMYANKMTKFWKPAEYNPYELITKEQAAKLLSIYHTSFLATWASTVICNYTDIDSSDLRSYIEDVCRYGIFPNISVFNPKDSVNKESFVKGILIMQWILTQQASNKTVIEKALENWLISANDLSTFDKPITRYEAAIMLHALYLKQTFINNLNSNNSIYYVISKSTSQYWTWSDSSTSGNEQYSFIDITTIDWKDFNNGYINLFGNVYKINKKEITSYFPTSYSWYGSITDINTDRVLWSINLAIGQRSGVKVVVEGYIVLDDLGTIYTILPTETMPYYLIKKIQ